MIVSTREDIAKRVRDHGGEGAHVVHDGVSKIRGRRRLIACALGMMVSYGNASGPAPAISPLVLSQKGSLFLTRPTLFHYTANTKQLDETAADLFGVIAGGAVKIARPRAIGSPKRARARRSRSAQNHRQPGADPLSDRRRR